MVKVRVVFGSTYCQSPLLNEGTSLAATSLIFMNLLPLLATANTMLSSFFTTFADQATLSTALNWGPVANTGTVMLSKNVTVPLSLSEVVVCGRSLTNNR